MLKKAKPSLSWMARPLAAFGFLLVCGPVADVLLTVSGATAQEPGTAGQQRELVLEGGTLIDGTGAPPIPDAVVVVQGMRIIAVGRKGQVPVPANANVINLAGRTILPGLIDSHTHTQDWQLPMFLPYGVTTIADENNDTTWILTQRELLKSGKINGPRMFAAGTAMDGTLQGRTVGQFNTPIATTAADARAIEQSRVAAGVDIVKVLQDVTNDQLSAAIAVAKEAGLPAMGHTRNIRKAAELGFKFAEHTWTIAFALLDPEDKTMIGLGSNTNPPPEALVDPKTFPALVAYLAKQGVYLNPTLANTWGPSTPRWQEMMSEAALVKKDPGLGFVPAAVKEGWTSIPSPLAGWGNVKEFLHEYAVAGGKVVVGTDTGFSVHMIPGLAVHQEMQLLVDVGYSPMQVIQAATLWNAELLKKDKDLGSIQPGKLADFTIIEGNPLANISATKNVRMVIKEGKVMDIKYDPKWVNPVPSPYSSFQAPRPSIAMLTPRMAHQGSGTITLQIEGALKGTGAGEVVPNAVAFSPNAVVRFDNTDLPTHFVSSTKLTATLDARFLQSGPGSYAVYVVNPGVHGTVSTPVYFDVGEDGIDGYAVVDGRVTNTPLPAALQPSSPIFIGPTPRSARQGGQSVTLQIQGTEFAPNAVVRFDNAELPTHFISSTELTATLDARLLQRNPGAYVTYVVNPGPHGTVSAPGYFLVSLKQ